MEDFNTVFKKKLLETLHCFIVFLNQHNIPYWAFAGTCLGAVRHHDIIPWDDDIDLLMRREDLDKLYELKDELAAIGLSYEYINDYGYNHSYAKVTNVNTTIWEQKRAPICSGLWIDVFALYERDGGVSAIRSLQHEFARKFKAYHVGVFKSLPSLAIVLWKGGFEDLRSYFSNKKCYKEFLTFEKTLNQKSGPNYVVFMGNGAEVYNREWFDKFEELPFSDFMIRVPSAYHDFLIFQYGDYMKLPPEEKRFCTHKMYYVNLSEGLTIPQIKARIAKGEYRHY